MIAIVEKLLISAGSMIVLILGSLHFYYTFFSEKFFPRNPVAALEMKKTSLRITKDTTVWKAWIGFNGSHSSGAIYFGLINLFIVTFCFDIVNTLILWHMLNVTMAAFYFFLAKRYWFRIPFAGMVIATFCFGVSFLLSLLR
jgi:hypothetical protein